MRIEGKDYNIYIGIPLVSHYTGSNRKEILNLVFEKEIDSKINFSGEILINIMDFLDKLHDKKIEKYISDIKN